jgi:hypothetical protein
MATELLATGTAAADSADVVVTAGTPVTIYLKKGSDGAVSASARATVKIKSSGGTYHEIGALTGQYQALVIDGPGTYRISRETASEAFGVEKE